VAAAPALLLLWFAALPAQDSASFRRPLGGAEIDWSAGTITAMGGAAADLRMPNPSAARPGAERRARAAAEEKLRVALTALAPASVADAKAAATLLRAKVARTEYQSNGGVVLWLALRFSDVAEAKPSPVVLRVVSMPFAFAPVIAAGGKTATLGFATFRPAAECPKDAVAARRDSEGRLGLAGQDAKLIDSLAGAAVVIYLEKSQP
jgi:hypothetical protein